MNQEYEEILNRLKEIESEVKSNTNMLISIQRRARMAILFSTIKWMIIFGITFGTFIYAKPYLEQLLDLYSQLLNQQQQAGNLIEGFKELLR
jgi:hypothetical protein